MLSRSLLAQRLAFAPVASRLNSGALQTAADSIRSGVDGLFR
jgi:hypothetical protein